MDIWGYSIVSVVIVSLLSLIGILALLLKRDVNKIAFLLVSFAVGGLFGDAFIHLLPESFKKIDNDLEVALLILLGLFIFFILEKVLRWRHQHYTTDEKHVQPVALINLIGDAILLTLRCFVFDSHIVLL